MGMRGINATPKRRKPSPSASLEQHPWDAPSLSRAERVVRFVNSLPCTAGPLAGKPLKLRPWQRKFIKAVYRTDKAGNRLVRTAVLSVGRKNGKTQLAAALCLCALSGPEAEPRGECYAVACTRFQAGRVFNEMVAIITKTPWLNERINIVRFRKELEDLENGSTFDVLSADVAPVHGLSPSFICYDELAQVPSRALYDALGTALGGRAQPLMMVISTQAARDEAPMSELVDYGLRIQRGEIVDPGFHLTLYSAPPEVDPWKLATWKMANPALGDFRSLEDVKRLALQAQRMPAAEMSFRNLILNQRCDTTAQFINAAAWKGCDDEVNIASLKGRPCYAGLDLGATKDMTALVLAFGDTNTGFDVLPYCWLDGTYNIRALAFDRWRVEDLKRELDAIGCNVPLTPFGQGFKDQSPAVDTLEQMVEEGKIRHGQHPVLAMAVTNAKAETDAAGNRKLSKRRSVGRIDPVIALTMALGVAKRPTPAFDPMTMIG
jgi:phage terminase large subunit-like protein